MRFEFWYDFSSPYAYLGSTAVEGVADRTGAELVWRPFLLGGLFKIIGTPIVPLNAAPEAKRRYLLKDQYRWAEHRGVPFALPSRFPMRTVTALRMALQAGDGQPAFAHRVFRAYWGEDRDINDPEELKALADEVGLDGAALLEGTQDPTVKKQLIDATNEAAERGICGAPSFFVGDLLFWGQDRLELVEKALGGWRPKGE